MLCMYFAQMWKWGFDSWYLSATTDVTNLHRNNIASSNEQPMVTSFKHVCPSHASISKSGMSITLRLTDFTSHICPSFLTGFWCWRPGDRSVGPIFAPKDERKKHHAQSAAPNPPKQSHPWCQVPSPWFERKVWMTSMKTHMVRLIYILFIQFKDLFK